MSPYKLLLEPIISVVCIYFAHICLIDVFLFAVVFKFRKQEEMLNRICIWWLFSVLDA